MGIIDTIKGVTNHLPGLRRPERYSLFDLFMDEYGWSFTTPDKHIGDLFTYHQAFEKNIWVRRCCMAICDEITFESTSLPFLTTAAAVSSQELSIANIFICLSPGCSFFIESILIS